MKTIKLTLFVLVICCFFASQRNSKAQMMASASSECISDDSLLTLVQYQTFKYFWDGAEPVSGMARERINVNDIYPENDKNIITTGGSGFGIMAVIIGIERGFITREQGLERLGKNIEFLKKADRYHGVWPHWLNGETAKVRPFSPKDDGADLVETSYLMQGLLAARQYFNKDTPKERMLVAEINKLWNDIDFQWFTHGKDVLYWHWSPNFGWEMNFPVEGYNECLIMYILAASSPNHKADAAVYHKGWARSGGIKGNSAPYGYPLSLKHNGAIEYGGPLFWAHYSYLGLDPRELVDTYANYWEHNTNQTLINRQWCIENPKKFKGYSEDCWGLTASYSVKFYAGHAPGKENDLGVISPTAAISSIPYTPEYSLQAMRHFYFQLGDQIWGEYGFYDAFSIHDNWYPKQYLAIDQGPEIVMIENYRTGLIWKLFMSCPEISNGLKTLGFSSPYLQK
ncbi:MAG: beta-glucosidase [Bacteroidales bacterium]|nr:beta-glucosidase [Bacteroidales bacterium]